MGPKREGRFRVLLWVLLAVLALIPYLSSLSNPVIHDDRALLIGNAWLADEATAASLFQADYWAGTRMEGSDLYRPVTVLSLMWNLRYGGGSVSFRIVNLLLHAGVVLMLAWLLLNVLPAGSRNGAWFGAALFAVHPLGSEAVLWIVGRAEMLAALFGIAAFILYVQLSRRTGFGGWRLLLSAILFLLALASKESAAVWIGIGIVWVFLQRKEPATSRLVRLLHGAVYLGVLGLFLLVRGSAVGWGTKAPFFVDNPLVAVDAPARIANAVLLQGYYGYKMIWPKTLSIDWAYDQLPVLDLVWAAPLALIFLAAWFTVAWLLRKRSVTGLFLWVAVAAGFAVTANVLVPIGANFAERLAYLPLSFACGLAGFGLSRLRWSTASIVALMAVAVLLAGVRTGIRTTDFRSSTALYEATAAASPRAVKSLTTLGNIRLRQDNRPDLAIPILEQVVSIWPDYPRALSSLSEAYARTGNRTGAVEMDRRAREAARKLQEMQR